MSNTDHAFMNTKRWNDEKKGIKASKICLRIMNPYKIVLLIQARSHKENEKLRTAAKS